MFKVTEIINSNTIRVSPNWEYKPLLEKSIISGDIVKIKGYDIETYFLGDDPTKELYDFVENMFKSRLETLLKHEDVTLAYNNEDRKEGLVKDGIMFCKVKIRDLDISFAFPDCKMQSKWFYKKRAMKNKIIETLSNISLNKMIRKLSLEQRNKVVNDLVELNLSDTKQKKLPKLSLSKTNINELQYTYVDKTCLNYRHDFGLLTEEEKNNIRFDAKEWLMAWQRTEKYS